MSEKRESYYKTCRKLAGMTQEQTAPLLGVEPRRLSAYENGERVPEDIVDRMAEVYNAPLLAIWHIKEISTLGRKYLPDFYPTRTNNDLGFQTVLANEDASRAERNIKKALEDGLLTVEDMPYIDAYIKSNDACVGKLISTKAYMMKIKNDLSLCCNAKTNAPPDLVRQRSARS